jgi:hypothetical protein
MGARVSAKDFMGEMAPDDWSGFGVEDPPVGPDVLKQARQRFGSRCPACGSILGDLPATDSGGLLVDRPALFLEVGGLVADERSWRLSVVGRTKATLRSYDPLFDPHSVEYTYLLCGNGHIFPFASMLGQAEKAYAVHYWNTIAAMGPSASGKTYLLTRMLDQELIHVGRFPTGSQEERLDVRLYAGAPLEDHALEQRRLQYDETLTTGRPIDPTRLNTLAPYQILNRRVAPFIFDAAIELLKDTVIPAMVNETRWGVNPPQPIMARTRVGDGPRARQGWTCVVDLAGEFFDDQAAGNDNRSGRDRSALRNYNALVWVIDPVLEARTFDPFAREPLEAQQPGSFLETVQGSLRAGTTTSGDRDAQTYVERVRANRRRIQRRISERITRLDGEFLSDDLDQIPLMIAVSKVDLIHRAISKATGHPQTLLTDLGEPGMFESGIVHYLHHVAQNAGITYHPVGDCAELLRRIDEREVTDRGVLNGRLVELAKALVGFYTDPDHFWALVEEGSGATVPLAPDHGIPGSYDGPVLRVPTIDEHLHLALRPGPPDAAGRLGIDDPFLTRDLVMSALGCGMVFALGYSATIKKLMTMPWIDLRLFLCSPLAAVPKAVINEDDDAAMATVRDDESFADLGTRSAALTQLLLRVLRRVL